MTLTKLRMQAKLQTLFNSNKALLLSAIRNKDDHASERHVGLSNAQMLDDVLKDNMTPAASTFASEAQMNKAILQSLIADPAQLYEAYMEAGYNENITIHVDLKDTPAGEEFKGVNHWYGRIRQMTTSAVTMVLRKTKPMPEFDNEFGIKLRTAYPYLMSENARETDYDLTRDAHKTRAYHKNDPVFRTYIDLACDHSFNMQNMIFKEHYNENTKSTWSELKCAVPSENRIDQHRIRLTESRQLLATLAPDDTGKLNHRVRTAYTKSDYEETGRPNKNTANLALPSVKELIKKQEPCLNFAVEKIMSAFNKNLENSLENNFMKNKAPKTQPERRPINLPIIGNSSEKDCLEIGG